MSVEIRMLLYTVILGIIQLLLATHFATLKRGVMWNMGTREEKMPELTGVAGRLERAFKNLLETLPFFIAAVLAVEVTDNNVYYSLWSSQIYFFSRLLYLPAYAFGIMGVRTLLWACSMLGIVLTLASCFI